MVCRAKNKTYAQQFSGCRIKLVIPRPFGFEACEFYESPQGEMKLVDSACALNEFSPIQF